MTREEAIRWLEIEKSIIKEVPEKPQGARELKEALDMAIEALSAEPKLIRVEYSPFRIKETSTPSQTSFRGTQEVHYYEVPSVVRCKDCRHADECHKSVQYTLNEPRTVTIGYSPIEWCSWGERREP